MRRAIFFSAMLFTAMLCLSGIGLAAAEPHKNQIVVDATCVTNGQSYTFVINGMSKTGHVTPRTDVTASNVNVVVKQFIVTYFDEEGNQVGSDAYVNPVIESGNEKGFTGDLIQCSGITPEPIVLQGLGPVTAEYTFQAFVTPRGKA
jgi:hypothetical protein